MILLVLKISLQNYKDLFILLILRCEVEILLLRPDLIKVDTREDRETLDSRDIKVFTSL